MITTSTTLGHIAFVDDDDEGPMELYREALGRVGFKLRDIRKVSEVFDYFRKNELNPVPDLWIIDIMMPIGEQDLDDAGFPLYQRTSYGLSSGLVVCERVRAAFPDVPILILTSITTPDILENLPVDEKTQILSKIQVLPSELATLSRAIINPRA